MITSVEQVRRKPEIASGKVRTYGEIVEYLDALTHDEYSPAAVARIKELDRCLDNVASKVQTILVGGTNGKSLTMHFAAKLLKEEGFKIGLVYSSHVLTYNERMEVDLGQISNKVFSDLLNNVIDVARQNQIDATAYEILLMAGLLHAHQEKVDVALVEVCYGGLYDAAIVCNPLITALTRIAQDQRGKLDKDLDIASYQMIEVARPGSWFISAEQSKLRLQKMKTFCQDRDIKWAMPIRKLAQLPYIYEQLYGRIASLGERIAQIYAEDIKGKFSPFLRGNLLATQKGQRGRPTLEAKRHAELNPIKTLKGFWTEQFDLLRCRFQLLDKEKPSMLLDNAANLDALTNFFLGVRLLHYQRPLKGLALVLGLSEVVDATETLKLIRYLLKKVSGQVFFVSLGQGLASHDPVQLAQLAKELNIKARACGSFAEAIEQAKTVVDDRDGLVAVAGATKLVSEYWKWRGVKRF